MKTPDYMSYSRYKEKKTDNSKKRLLIGITTFFATLLFFIVVAKQLSPDVDITIGEDSDVEAKESGLGVKKFIDDRLKMIQMEDNSAGASKTLENPKTKDYNDASFDKFSKELNDNMSSSSSNDSYSEEIDEPVKPVAKKPPRPTSADVSAPVESTRVSKVVVGYYSTLEQAKVAQGILLDSGISISPFVKNIGGAYTLQVGSYSSRSKAESVMNELLRNNFPARIIQE